MNTQPPESDAGAGAGADASASADAGAAESRPAPADESPVGAVSKHPAPSNRGNLPKIERQTDGGVSTTESAASKQVAAGESSSGSDGNQVKAEHSESNSRDAVPLSGMVTSVTGQSAQRPAVAIVTGAARRVGREIALSMAKRGLGVVVHHGTSKVEADSLVTRIRGEGGQAIAVAADLRDPRNAALAVLEAADKLGPASVLINSAAVFQDRALPWIDLYHCNLHTNVNLLAPVFLIQQFVKQLGEGETAHVVNILDWRAMRHEAGHLIYTATKAAMVSITKSLALQLAPRVYVNAIAPGAILPPEDRTNWHQQRAIESIPLKKTGSPRDVCDAINFLLDSRFITGEVLHVSGGEEL